MYYCQRTGTTPQDSIVTQLAASPDRPCRANVTFSSTSSELECIYLEMGSTTSSLPNV